MRKIQKHSNARASVLAVRGALIALIATQPAFAADSDDVLALTQPTNSISVGIGNVDESSYKFSEYNGLDKKGTFFIGGIDLRGGDSYESGNALRWRVLGTNLGLDTRALGAEFGRQGRFRVSLGFDQIQQNQYDSFRTIFSGAGTTTLIVPHALNAANHPAQIGGISTASTTAANIATVTNATTANLFANFGNIQSPNLSPGTLAAPNTVASTSAAAANAGMGWLIPAAMQNVKIGTERRRGNAAVDVVLTDSWSFKASIFSETKEGLKLTGVGSVNTGSGVTAPEPVEYTTNIVKAAFNYVDPRGHLDFGYTGSIFKNDINTWTAASIWANNSVQGNVNRMIGAPDNEYHQFKAAGGYNFSKATKLAVSASRATSTQNEEFIANGPFWYVPASSANAKIVNTNFLARLTSRTGYSLDWTASYRYEDRDNKTPYLQVVSTGRDANGSAGTTNPCGPGALPQTAAIRVAGLTCYDNLPINIRQQQIVLEGNYRIARGQAFKFGYEWQKIKRDSDEENQDPFRAHETKEQTVRLQYRNSFAENLTGRIGYDYSQRRHSEFEIEPPLGGVLAAAVEPILPNLINYIVASRNRDRLRGGIDFQASDSVALSAGLDYNNDRYIDDGLYGKKGAKSWVLNLETSFAVSEKLALSAYYTFEDHKSSMTSLSVLRANPAAINPAAAACRPYPTTASYSATGAAVAYGSPSDWYTDPCRIWGESQSDKVQTLGVTFKAKASPVLDLEGALAYSYALTPISMTGMQVVSNGLTIGAYGTNAAVNNNIFIPVASMPDSKSTMWDFRIAGRYAIDKVSAIRLAYGYRKLTSSDAQWDAYAANPVALQGYVGTGIASPTYKVNVVSATYLYSFR